MALITDVISAEGNVSRHFHFSNTSIVSTTDETAPLPILSAEAKAEKSHGTCLTDLFSA